MRRRGADHRGVATFNYDGFVLAATGIVRSSSSHTHSRRNLCCGNHGPRMNFKDVAPYLHFGLVMGSWFIFIAYCVGALLVR